MALSGGKNEVSRLPLRQTDIGGRLRLLREAGLVRGDVETGLMLMGDRTLIETTELMKPPVENVIGAIPYQLGLATNFRVNGREVLVPMAVREPTIIAGLSKAAKLALPEGFSAGCADGNRIKSEILFSGFASMDEAEGAFRRIRERFGEAIRKAEKTAPSGSRIVGHETLFIAPENRTDRPLVAAKITIETGDLMGARVATAIGRKVADGLKEASGCRASTVICSNRGAGRTVFARAVWPWSNIGRKTGRAILDLQRWADKDRDREATHDKGVMNAVMGVCRATGQDEEAVWSSMWTWVRPDPDRKTQLTSYSCEYAGLVGEFRMMIPVATRGGATDEPFARMCRALMDAKDGRELAHVIGAVGLAANFAALYCLANEGILAAFERVRQE